RSWSTTVHSILSVSSPFLAWLVLPLLCCWLSSAWHRSVRPSWIANLRYSKPLKTLSSCALPVGQLDRLSLLGPSCSSSPVTINPVAFSARHCCAPAAWLGCTCRHQAMIRQRYVGHI